jgi:predicted Zn-dependent peptidase
LKAQVSFDESAFQKKSDILQHPSKRVVIDLVESYQYNTVMSYPAYPYRNVNEGIILNFLKFCLTDAGLYSILSYEIREKRGLVYNIKTSNDRMRYLGLFKIAFGTSNKDVVSIVQVIQGILTGIIQNGLDAETLSFFKTSYTNHLRYRFINEDQKTTWQGDNLFYGVNVTEEKLFRAIEAIDNSDIKKIAKDIFDPLKLCIYTMGNYHDIKGLRTALQNASKELQHPKFLIDQPKAT